MPGQLQAVKPEEIRLRIPLPITAHFCVLFILQSVEQMGLGATENRMSSTLRDASSQLQVREELGEVVMHDNIRRSSHFLAKLVGIARARVAYCLQSILSSKVRTGATICESLKGPASTAHVAGCRKRNSRQRHQHRGPRADNKAEPDGEP